MVKNSSNFKHQTSAHAGVHRLTNDRFEHGSSETKNALSFASTVGANGKNKSTWYIIEVNPPQNRRIAYNFETYKEPGAGQTFQI